MVVTSEIDLLGDESWIPQEEVLGGIVSEQAISGVMKLKGSEVDRHDQEKMELLE